MARIITVGAAQLGPIARAEPKAQVAERMLALMHEARGHGCDFVVFPELALTTFFNSYKNTTFNFARHREPEQYRMILERKGAVAPD